MTDSSDNDQFNPSKSILIDKQYPVHTNPNRWSVLCEVAWTDLWKRKKSRSLNPDSNEEVKVISQLQTDIMSRVTLNFSWIHCNPVSVSARTRSWGCWMQLSCVSHWKNPFRMKCNFMTNAPTSSELVEQECAHGLALVARWSADVLLHQA